MLPTRLDKYLRDSTHLPLTELRMACSAGRVRVRPEGGSIAPAEAIEADMLVFEGDTVEFDGRVVERGHCQQHTLAFNKPRGVTSTVTDPDGFEDLSRWLANMPPGVFPVGRLDRMTSGLLLFTSDGDLAHALLHPNHDVPKRYRLTVKSGRDDSEPRLLALRAGVRIAGVAETVRVDEVVVVHRSGATTTLIVQLHEGKHRQIRKMCHAVGLAVRELERVSIGEVRLDEQPPGTHRFLAEAEVNGLWASAGGRSTVIERQVRALQRRAGLARHHGCPLPRLERWLVTRFGRNGGP